MSKASLQDMLSTGSAVITFTKKDGTERVMRATTNLDKINYQFKTVNEERKPSNPGVLHVWDLDIKEWRSIRVNSITGYDWAA